MFVRRLKNKPMSIEQTNQLQKALKEFGVRTISSQKLFIDSSHLKDYKKNEVIFYENERNSSEYLLIEGILHRYNVNDKGENVTTGFYMANIAITPHSARTIKSNSIFTLQTLTPTKIAEIPVAILNDMRIMNEEYKAFGQKVLEAEIAKIFSNDLAFRSLDAKNRLIKLRKAYPGIENQIPHSVIASYLGITNVSFSRLRSEFAGK